MPELKNTFTGGKMEKDLDERIVPSGQYREALNISVSTSEGSDVGAAQNILGNIKVTEAIAGPLKDYSGCIIGTGPNRYNGTNKHITHVVDPQSDKLYRFIATTPIPSNDHGVWMDRIVEYDTNAKIETGWQEKEKAVMVDVYKVETVITSLDIISPPEPPDPPVTKYGCYEGSCVDCANIGCIGQTWDNDPTCGGGMCNEVTIGLAPITQCENRCDLIPPSEDPLTYTWTGSIIQKIEEIPSFSHLNQALWRYPVSGGGVWGPNNQPLGRKYNAMWGLAIIDDATDNNGNLLPFATASWETNVSGLLYDVVYSANTSGLGQYTFNTVHFNCPEDFITWINTIPDPVSYLVDGIGTPIGGFTTDHTNNWGVTPVIGGQGGMTQAIIRNIFFAVGSNNGWNIASITNTSWSSPHVSSQSIGGTVNFPIEPHNQVQVCCEGACTNYYTQNYYPTCP